MPITFDEVSAEIDRQPPVASTPAAAPATPPATDLREQIERELHLRDERLARLHAD